MRSGLQRLRCLCDRDRRRFEGDPGVGLLTQAPERVGEVDPPDHHLGHPSGEGAGELEVRIVVGDVARAGRV